MEKELENYITKFIFDIITMKNNIIMKQDDINIRNTKFKLIYETIKYYSENKKNCLNEDFDLQFLLSFNDNDNNDNDNNVNDNNVNDNNVNDNNVNDNNSNNSNSDDNDLDDNDLDDNNLDDNKSESNESNTDSEYEFSDVDELETQQVNKLMTNANIKLRRSRQSKIGIYINKKYLF